VSTRSSVNLLIATWICAFVGIQTPATAQNLKVAVGSKSFTESVILGEVLSHLASDEQELQVYWHLMQAEELPSSK